MAHNYLLEILKDLADEELSNFHWSMCDNSKDKIKKAQLTDSKTGKSLTREATVDLLVQTYTDKAVQKNTIIILEKIRRNDLVEKLTDTGTGAKGATATQLNGTVPWKSQASWQTELSPFPDIQDDLSNVLLAGHFFGNENLESVRARVHGPLNAQISMEVVKKYSDIHCTISFDLQLPGQCAAATQQNVTMENNLIEEISEPKRNSLLHKLLCDIYDKDLIAIAIAFFAIVGLCFVSTKLVSQAKNQLKKVGVFGCLQK